MALGVGRCFVWRARLAACGLIVIAGGVNDSARSDGMVSIRT